MKEELALFRFEDHDVRMFMIDGIPWGSAADVCSVLGYANPREVVRRLEPDDVRQIDTIDSLGRQQSITIINESGLYDLLARSDKPRAKPFRRWLFREVVPQIRKTGSYSVDRLPEITSIEEHLVLSAQRLLMVRQQQEALELVAKQHEQEIVEHATQLQDHAARLDSIEHNSGWVTAMYFTKKYRKRSDLNTVKALGRYTAKLLRIQGIEPGKIRDERYGEVNSYPETTLLQAWGELFGP